MKRIFSAFIALSAVFTIAGCSEKKSSVKESDDSSVTETTTTEAAAATQPDPLVPAVTTTSAPATDASTTTVPATESASDKPDITVFDYNSDGAVIFENDYKNESDATLMAAAQSLFESACCTEWSYTVGCPYETDPDSYIENEFQWRFYRITDSSIKSLADVERDYYKVFSPKYPNRLHELFIEKDGAVYSLNSARGANVFYERSAVTAITSQTDEEIFFTVENHYSGNDYNVYTPETKTAEFSVVIEDDGSWHAGKFRLPY